MKILFTFLSLAKKRTLFIWVTIIFLFSNLQVQGQIQISFGTMYNPELVTVKGKNCDGDVVKFKAYQYHISPYDEFLPPVYAVILHRGDSYVDDPGWPSIIVQAEYKSPLQPNAFAELGNVIPVPTFIPLLNSTFVQTQYINPPKEIADNPPFTSPMAISVYWGIQYLMDMNNKLYLWGD